MIFNYLILDGVDRSGKTSTLHFLVECLSRHNNLQVKVKKRCKSIFVRYTGIPDELKNNDDRHPNYIYTLNTGFDKIGVITLGDVFYNERRPYECLFTHLKIIENEGCSFVIMASHSDFINKIIEWADNYFGANSVGFILNKSKDSRPLSEEECHKINRNFAKRIIKVINCDERFNFHYGNNDNE